MRQSGGPQAQSKKKQAQPFTLPSSPAGSPVEIENLFNSVVRRDLLALCKFPLTTPLGQRNQRNPNHDLQSNTNQVGPR